MRNQEAQREMFNMIAAWQQSGVSQKGYCEQQGIRYHVFHYWYKRYRSSRVVDSKPGFLPLHITPSAPFAAVTGIELILADGRRLLFNQPVTADFIKAVIS